MGERVFSFEHIEFKMSIQVEWVVEYIDWVLKEGERSAVEI